MSQATIRCDQDGPVLTVTLNRPDKLNAYTAAMGVELEAAFDRASEDDSVRVVILTGEGRGFCAGADLSAGASSFDTSEGSPGSTNFGARGETGPSRRAGPGFIGAIFNCKKPSIAAFNGAAVGVGVTLALPTDIKIASTNARFGFVFARRGLVPEAGSAWFLPKLVGLPQALRWCLSGELFGAEEALRGGLVSEVVAPDALLPRARQIALALADHTAPVSIALTRRMLWRASGETLPFDLLQHDGGLAMRLGAGGDVREGVASFMEKRAPAFSGRASADLPPSPWTDI